MRSLNWKISAALIFAMIVSAGLMVGLIRVNIGREFQEYVGRGSAMYTQSAADDLSQFYTREQSWADIQGILDSLLMSENDRLIVADNSGVIVGDTAEDWLGKDAEEVGVSGGTPVTASGNQVGRLYLVESSGGGVGPHIFDTADEGFLIRINRYVWIAGAIAVGVALLLGLTLTRYIIRPIRALTKGARHIAKGNLNYRVKLKSRDELGELAQSFNLMASSLESSEQARRRLNADIAHELRTPLTVIEGTVDGILDGVFEPDREHLGSIKEQTALLTRVIGDLRDLSLAEAGQLKLELTPTNMVDLVRRKLSQAEVRAREKGAQLKLNVSRGVPEIKVDSARMEQVIANLLANAIRYTPAGGSVSVSIEAVTSDSSHQIMNPSVIISVADTGEGIAPEHLPHIFERFYRTGDSRARSEGGTGLGLAIVSQMVQAHGGKVWVESEVGKGSTFYISLPLAKE